MDEPGTKFLRAVLRYMPDDECKAEVTEVFSILMREGQTRNAVAAFLYLIREYRADILAAARAKRAADLRARAQRAGA